MLHNRYVSGAAFALAVLVAAAGCGDKSATAKKKKKKSGSTSVAIVPNASVVLSADAKKFFTSSFAKKARDTFTNMAKTMGGPGGPASKADPLEEFGIDKDAVVHCTLSMNLEGIPLEGDLDETLLDAAVAVSLNKTLTLDQIKKGVEEQAKKDNKKVTFGTIKHAGVEILTVTGPNPDGSGNGTPDYIAALNGGKLLVMGTKKGITGSIDRHKSGKSEKIPATLAAVKKSWGATPAVYAVFGLTKEMKDKLKKDAAAPSPSGMPNPAAKFSSLKTVALKVGAGTSLDLNVGLELASGEDAMAARAYLDPPAGSPEAQQSPLAMVRMMAGMFLPGQKIPLLDSFKFTADGSTVNISMKLTEADLKVIESLGKPPAGGAPGSGAAPPGK